MAAGTSFPPRRSRGRAAGSCLSRRARRTRLPPFVVLREHYWSRLDASERDRVLEEGVEVMQYGDAAAQPRLAKLLGHQVLGADAC